MARRLTRSAARMNRIVAPSLSVKVRAGGLETSSRRIVSAVSVMASLRRTMWRSGSADEEGSRDTLSLKAMAVRAREQEWCRQEVALAPAPAPYTMLYYDPDPDPDPDPSPSFLKYVFL